VSFTLESGNKRLPLHSPVVMGILNVTPDSFYSQSRVLSEQAVVDAAGKMLNEGASILDVGGQSTRPGSDSVSEKEELERVYPMVEAIRKAFPETWISIDTYYSSVVLGCAPLNFDIVNDISAGEDDPHMLDCVSKGNWIYIAMHKLGKPKTMQENPIYSLPILEEVLIYFRKKSELYASSGIRQWILDPGFGFGKTMDNNYQLLKNMAQLKAVGVPILAGISRKSMIYKLLQTTPEGALNGSSVLHAVALQNGASILRVHDAKEAMETIALYNKLLEV